MKIDYLISKNEIALNNLSIPGIFEGDIEYDTDHDLGDIVSQTVRKWNTKSGPFVIIPYTIPSKLTQKQRVQIAKAIREFRTKTCIKYMYNTNIVSAVYIMYVENI